MEVTSMDFVHPTEELLEEYCFERVQEPVLSVLEEHLLVCEICRAEVLGLDQYRWQLRAALGESLSRQSVTRESTTRESTTRELTASRSRAKRSPQLNRVRPTGVTANHPPDTAFVPPTFPSYRDARLHSPGGLASFSWSDVRWANIRLLDIPWPPLVPRLAGMGLTAVVLVVLGMWLWQKLPANPAAAQWASLQPTVVTLQALRGGFGADSTGPHSNRAHLTGPLQITIDAAQFPDLKAAHLQIVDEDGREIWTGAAVLEQGRISAKIPRSMPVGAYWVRLSFGNDRPGNDRSGNAGSRSGTLLREFSLQID